jgi:dephospho-CoA kinase
MKIIGLTGQSGAGKGVASAIFQKYGIPAVDTDAVYHEILRSPGPCTAELTEAFGTAVLGKDGLVDRKMLAGAVFGKPNTPTLLHTLNAITHKYIMTETREMLAAFAKNGARAAIIDAPQLYEAGVERECDWVVAVLAPRQVRLDRIVARDGISPEAAARRIDAQKPDTFYREHCDAILENDGNIAALEEQICAFLNKYNVGLS